MTVLSPSEQPAEQMEMVEYEELDGNHDIISRGSCPRYIIRYMREEKGMNIRIVGEDE